MVQTMQEFRLESRQWLHDNCPESVRKPGFIPWGSSKIALTEDNSLWLSRMSEKGWTVPTWPEEYGGGGLGKEDFLILLDELQRIQARPPLLGMGISMIGPTLLEFGSEEQKLRHLPAIVRGDIAWCQGYSEPGSGSDLASLKLRADADGDDYIVNGSKIWTTHAHMADHIFCLVRTDNSGRPQQGISFLLIDMDSPGVSVEPIITMAGDHEVNQVFFENVRVPQANRIGEENKGWTYAKGLLAHERSGLAGIQNSVMGLEKAKRNAQKVRVGAGTLLDLSSFKNKVGVLEAELLALEFTEMRTLARVAAGGDPGPESAILKLKGTEIQQRITELNLEAAGVFAAPWGAEAFGPEFAHGATQSYLGGRATTIYGGASEVQKDIITKKVLGIKSTKK